MTKKEKAIRRDEKLIEKADKKIPVKKLTTREQKFFAKKKELAYEARAEMDARIKREGFSIAARNRSVERSKTMKEQMSCLPLKKSVKKIYGIGEVHEKVTKQPSSEFKKTLDEKKQLKRLMNKNKLAILNEEEVIRFQRLSKKYKDCLWSL